MRIKYFKKTILVFMFFALCFAFAGRAVYASEKTCVTHKNYYLFVHATGDCMNEADKDQESGSCYPRTKLILEEMLGPNDTYFTYPTASDNATISDLNYKNVTVYKTGDAPSGLSLKLDLFYNRFQKAMTDSSHVSESVTVGGKEFQSYYFQEENEDKSVVTRYYARKSYLNSSGQFRSGIDIAQLAPADLVGASFIPRTTVSPAAVYDDSNNEIITISVTRHAIAAADRETIFQGVQPITFSWPTDESEYVGTGLKVAPAAYYVEYKECTGGKDGDKAFTATIKYLNRANKKAVALPFEKDYYDGEEEVVASPTVPGCVAEEKSVTVKIEGEDFNETVWYNCTVSNNSQTGTVMFVVCMVIGFSCLAYFLYYMFVGRKKANNNDI